MLIAYPELSEESYDLIQAYRKQHDVLYYNLVAPHVTFVFPVEGISELDFINEVESLVTHISPVDFVLRCATVNKDAFREMYHTFLVPDEGYGRIIKLHDQLYSQLFKQHLRLDIDFIPHIGIGNSTDKFICKQMADEWNRNDFSIAGRITALSLVKYENNLIQTIHEVKLLDTTLPMI